MLLEDVGPHLEGQGSTNGKSLLPCEKILIFLFFLAGNSLYRVKNYAHDIGYGTIVNTIHACIDVLYDNFVGTYIKLPTEDQAKREAELFHSSSGFPKVIWSALGRQNLTHALDNFHLICFLFSDGTHIEVSPLRKIRGAFRNRKGTLSINCMLLVGASGLTYYCKSSSPGSRHDSSVFKSSRLFHKLHEEKWSPLKNGVIAADSGYATYHPFLCTPFCEATTDVREIDFNKKFCKARVHVENVIGRVKNRWRILLKGIRLRNMTTCAKVIQCCVALNNFIILKDSECLDMDENIEGYHGFDESSAIPDWDVIPDQHRNGRIRRTPTREKLLAKYF